MIKDKVNIAAPSCPNIGNNHDVRSPLLSDYLHLYLGCRVYIDNPNAAFNKDVLDCDLLERLYNDLHISDYKLILRPLSDATPDEIKEIEDSRVFLKATPVHHIGNMQWTPETFRLALSKHFDLFGLIDNGLAIKAVSKR